MQRRHVTRQARELVQLLREQHRRIVFAESCTGGLVAATLTGSAGVSEQLCGSAVVYRLDTKARWLGVERNLLENPGPVSREVALAMAHGALDHTPEADLAASITGHLGPDAPDGEDGLVYVAVASRRPGDSPWYQREILPEETGGRVTQRLKRQLAATHLVLAGVCAYLRR